ncbi:hypothetical protein AZL_016910 [Azospirillum sp. B510]|uniref:hypothetical protein n=1 Tax=Azospirillum sp. (strain B510) TaxID=137722 RepID=UPI0001C4BFD7|nr:hypothetical protein [Azospirillum sp. B510]BAI72329.1 hypothetical protein AZL_016910 [Azospirillum sp. B510]
MPADCLPPNKAAANAPDNAANAAAAGLPWWAEDPPVPADGSLVPGSRFHEEQWVMAAGMLARGASFQQVARAMGCSRTTLWRAYYGSPAFTHRVWWERQALNRESELRLASLRALATEQIERLVSAGDPSTVRWVADRLGLFKGLDSQPAETVRPAAAGWDAAPPDTMPSQTMPPASPAPDPMREAGADPEPAIHPAADPAADCADAPIAHFAAGLAAADLDDDSVPGALRERTPPDPHEVAAVLARPEAEGPKGVYPWTLNPDDRFPNLGSARERRGGAAAFPRRGG